MDSMTNSHILTNQFGYVEPTSLEEAVTLLAQHGKNAKVLAGGTDLIVQMKMERVAPKVLVSIGRISGLDRIAVDDRDLRIGAGATIAAIERDLRVQEDYPALADACAGFSTTQVQVMGTVGGNLGNGSPAADCAPALIALGAEVDIKGCAGTRRVPVEEFFVGPGRTVLENELITDVVLRRPRVGTGSAFLKIGRVVADVAKASGAAMIVRDGDRIVDCRLAFGSVAPTPLRTRGAEQMLIGQLFSGDLVEKAARMAASEVTPIDDVRSQAWYRRDAVRTLAFDGLYLAWRRAERQRPELVEGPEGGGEAAVPAPAESRVHSLRADEKCWVDLNINGTKHQVWIGPNDLLLNVLRDQLQLTGSKYGCGIGECSACTVQLDGQPVLSCLMLAVSAVGHDVLTVEGLRRPNGDLDPLQEAFIEAAAYQCGYCTPGMLLTAKSLLAERPHLTESDVRHYLRGNVCRCTGYATIVRAVLNCAEGASCVE